MSAAKTKTARKPRKPRAVSTADRPNAQGAGAGAAAKAASRPEPNEKHTCATCPHGLVHPTLDNQIVCKRYPNTLLKAPADWCGEHPERVIPSMIHTEEKTDG